MFVAHLQKCPNLDLSKNDDRTSKFSSNIAYFRPIQRPWSKGPNLELFEAITLRSKFKNLIAYYGYHEIYGQKGSNLARSKSNVKGPNLVLFIAYQGFIQTSNISNGYNQKDRSSHIKNI